VQGFLKAIQAAGAEGNLKHIRTLAFDGTSLRPEHLPAFQDALNPLHETLQTLTISSVEFAAPRTGQKPFSAGDKWMLFRAIAKVSSLQTLKLPEALWKGLLSDGSDVADPLRRIKGLVVQDAESGVVLGSGGDIN
jgi:hypothetical protein